MNRLLEVCTICVVTLLLAGCFPSQRLYRVDTCNGAACGSLTPVNSELAFVKETDGEMWRVWVKQPNGTFLDICTSTIENNVFMCDKCEPGKVDSFVITKADSGACGFNKCVTITLDGRNCPGGGNGTGGHN